MRWKIILLVVALMALLPVQAQEGLNLPTELYVLFNEGRIDRFGLGAAGVRQVTEADAFVLDFRVAPDGNWLAYRTLDGLFLRDMFTEGNLRQIEDSRASVPLIRGEGETIAWTNTSDALAYTTEYGGRVYFFDTGTFADLTTAGLRDLRWSPDGAFLAAEAEGGVWWIFQRNGAEMTLRAAIPGANGGDWRTSRQFIFAPVEGGISMLDLSSGNLQIPVQDAFQNYYLPTALADGRVRVFVGEMDAARLLEVTFTDAGINTLEVGAAAISLTDVRWASGGNLLVAFQGGALGLVDPFNGGGFTLPLASVAAYSWGILPPPSATGFTLPTSGTFLAQDFSGVAQIWQLPPDGTLPATITPAEMDIQEYALSPDGTRVAYVSNGALWLYEIGSDSPEERQTLGIAQGVTPAWSPDSAAVYYRDEQSAGNGIWRVTLEGEPELFLADAQGAEAHNPQPAAGIAALLVQRGDSLVVVDTVSGVENVLGVRGMGQWLDGSRLLLTGEGSEGSGLYEIDANAPEQPATLLLPLLGNLQLLDAQAIDASTLRLLVQNRIPGEVQVLELPRTGGEMAFVTTIGYISQPQLSPDGSVVIGYTVPGGALISVDVATGERRMLQSPAQVMAFRWR